MYSCSSPSVDSNVGFMYICSSQCVKYCLMFYGIKCVFIVNVSDRTGYTEFISPSCKFFDCLKMSNYRMTFYETGLLFWMFSVEFCCCCFCNIRVNSLLMWESRLIFLLFPMSRMSWVFFFHILLVSFFSLKSH